MIAFLFRRLLHAVVVLCLVSVIAFALQQIAPGTYFDEMRLDPAVSPERVAAWKAQYGLNAPLPERYARWVAGAVRGDWGVSFAYGIPVRHLVWPRVVNTLQLTSIAIAISWLLAIFAGAAAACFETRPVQTLAAAGSAALMAVPEAIAALALVLIAIRTGLWQTTEGGTPRVWLPAAALVVANAPPLFRYVRASLLEAGSLPFITASRASGIGGAALFGHVLRAGANPLISIAGLSIGGLLSTSLVAETITGWPGLGSLMLEAVFSRDVFVVMASVLLSAALFIAGSVAADIALYASDPRIRRSR